MRGRRLRFVAALLLVLLISPVLGGCAWLDVWTVRAGVSQALDRCVSPTEDDVAAFFADAGMEVSDLADAGIDAEAFAQHAFARFGYDIEDVSVSGDCATVLVAVSGVDCGALMAQVADELAADSASWEDLLLGEDGERELVAAYFERLYARLDAAEPTTREARLLLVRDGGDWQLDAAGEADLARTVFGGADGW